MSALELSDTSRIGDRKLKGTELRVESETEIAKYVGGQVDNQAAERALLRVKHKLQGYGDDGGGTRSRRPIWNFGEF